MAAATTLCIVGFPEDVNERELHNLCRWTTGFQQANVVKRTMLFVKFASHREAVNAIKALNGAPFDAREPDSVMKVEYARREMILSTSVPGPAQPSAPWKERGRKRGHELETKCTSTGEELHTIKVLQDVLSIFGLPKGPPSKQMMTVESHDEFAQIPAKAMPMLRPKSAPQIGLRDLS